MRRRWECTASSTWEGLWAEDGNVGGQILELTTQLSLRTWTAECR